MKVVIVVIAIGALVAGEPPVPSSRYLPGAKTSVTVGNEFFIPSLQYGTPEYSESLTPNTSPSQYTVPSSKYATPSQSTEYKSTLSQPSAQYGVPSSKYGAPGDYAKQSSSYDAYTEPANYNFQYDVQEQHEGTDFGHAESRQGDAAHGKYYVTLPDGRKQTVEYTADEHGYQPRISYEETNNVYASRHAVYANRVVPDAEYNSRQYSAQEVSKNGYSEQNGYQY